MKDICDYSRIAKCTKLLMIFCTKLHYNNPLFTKEISDKVYIKKAPGKDIEVICQDHNDSYFNNHCDYKLSCYDISNFNESHDFSKANLFVWERKHEFCEEDEKKLTDMVINEIMCFDENKLNYFCQLFMNFFKCL